VNGKRPLNVIQITSKGFSSISTDSSPYTARVKIDGLIPSTIYNIYCATEDTMQHTMPFEDVLSSYSPYATPCCKKLIATKFSNSISFSSSAAVTQPQFSFQLNFQPTSTLNVFIRLYRYASCPIVGTQNIDSISLSLDLMVSPSTVSLNALSTFTSFNVLVLGTINEVGCYLIAITSQGTDSPSPLNITFVANTQVSQPSIPNLKSAYWSNDGTALQIQFDSPTNQGMPVGYTIVPNFQCQTIFNFKSIKESECTWATNSEVLVRFDVLSTYPDSVTLKSGRIQALCTVPQIQQCESYNYSSAMIVNITGPINPLKPSSIVSSASVISICTDLSLDPTGSQGKGNRPWKSVQWNVTVSNAALITQGNKIEQFLNKY
jgi:hypothetical protein